MRWYSWYLKAWKNYAVFDGRAQRKEYWFFLLVHLLMPMSLTAVVVNLDLDPRGSSFSGLLAILGLYAFATVVPSCALMVRRLHDIGRSGWWLLLGIVPYLGGLVIMVLLAIDGDSGENKYGPDPKEEALSATAGPETRV